MSDRQRVVVTGTGAVSCLGVGADTLWEALLAGRSGIGPITKFDASEFRCKVAGEVRDLDITEYLPPKEARRLDAFCHYAIAAADEAVAGAGLQADAVDPTRVGILVSTGIGGIVTLQQQANVLVKRGPNKCSPLMVPMMIGDMAAGALSIRYGFLGPNLAIVSACATGSHAIGEAFWMIRRGDADAMITGGTEAPIGGLGIAGFCAMKALTTRNDEPTRASRPFDADRNGFVPAEGAGVLVLESYEHARRRGAPILAELVGYGLSGDGYHITAPDPRGAGAARAIQAALTQAGVSPEEVGYINAHGTSTLLNDKVETLAIKTVFGAAAYRTPISSTKSMIGHALGAAGGLESLVCVRALMHAIVPGTMNYETPDPDCDLDYVPNVAREVAPGMAMNINLGFGGHNAALLFRKWD